MPADVRRQYMLLFQAPTIIKLNSQFNSSFWYIDHHVDVLYYIISSYNRIPHGAASYINVSFIWLSSKVVLVNVPMD